ncbi:MAG TPA: hypothetical protein VM618_12835, partial [Acidimicrobiia bacterium]|nr:hypothetical protein [Acidimicrobiia bacterium]
ARQRHDDYIRRSQERIAELRADAAAALERARDQIPDRFSAEAEISGDGEVVFGEALRVDGSVDLVSSNAGPDTSAAGSFRLVVQGSEARYLGPEGQWIAVPGPAGPLGTLMLDPSGVTRLLNDARTGVEDLGEDEIDGRRVRGYRFGVGSSVLAGVDDGADGTAEAWVDVEDEVLLRLTIRSTVRHDEGPRRGVLRTTLTMDLTDFGADVSVDVPPAQGRASSPLGPAAILYPFDAGFSVSFYAGIEVPEVPELPAIPEIDVEVPEIPEVPQIPPPPPPPSPEFQEPQYQEPEYEAPQYQEPEFEEPRYDEQYGSSGGAGF